MTDVLTSAEWRDVSRLTAASRLTEEQEGLWGFLLFGLYACRKALEFRQYEGLEQKCVMFCRLSLHYTRLRSQVA